MQTYHVVGVTNDVVFKHTTSFCILVILRFFFFFTSLQNAVKSLLPCFSLSPCPLSRRTTKQRHHRTIATRTTWHRNTTTRDDVAQQEPPSRNLRRWFSQSQVSFRNFLFLGFWFVVAAGSTIGALCELPFLLPFQLRHE